jgi:hypothetical protein
VIEAIEFGATALLMDKDMFVLQILWLEMDE